MMTRKATSLRLRACRRCGGDAYLEQSTDRPSGAACNARARSATRRSCRRPHTASARRLEEALAVDAAFYATALPELVGEMCTARPGCAPVVRCTSRTAR